MLELATRFTSLDTENIGEKYEYGLQPWRVAEKLLSCRTIAMTTRTDAGFKSAGSIRPSRDELANILEVMHANNRIVVGWNMTYDLAVLLGYGLTAEVSRLKILDAMLMWRRLEPFRHTHGLKEWLRLHAPQLNGYEVNFKDYFDPTKSPPSDEQLLEYNKIDTLGTLVAALYMWPKLGAKQQIASLIEGANLVPKAGMNLRGLPVSIPNTQIYYRQLAREGEEALAKLLPHLPDGKVPNFGSPAQLRRLLYDTWGLQAPYKTDKGNDSTDKAALKTLALDDPRALLLLQCRESKNSIKRYVSNVVESAKYHGPYHKWYTGGQVYVTRPDYKTAATYTGRGTYGSKQGRG